MMHDIFKNHADHILDFIHTVEFLIPEVRIKSRRRTSRGLCNLCGDVYRVSFCLAIGNELADLASLVEKTAQVQGKRLDEYGNALSAFASFTQVTNAKLQSLSDIAEALNKRRMSIDEEAHRRAYRCLARHCAKLAQCRSSTSSGIPARPIVGRGCFES
jgi:hypothetical protein